MGADNIVNQGGDRRSIGGVTGGGIARQPFGGDQIGGFRGRRRVTVDRHHMGTGAGEGKGAGLAIAPTGPRRPGAHHQRHTVLQPSCHIRSFPRQPRPPIIDRGAC